MHAMNLNDLRKRLRQQRQSLTHTQQRQASLTACTRLARQPQFQRSQRVAAYLTNNGELDPMPLINLCWKLNKQVYLPVLHPVRSGELVFMRYQPHQTLALNRYGIPEPVCRSGEALPTWTLDLVLTPLVGFDANRHRIGMGGGYYDRTFAFTRQAWRARKPRLIGLAHDCQQVEQIAMQPWDIHLDWVLTGTRLFTEADTEA